MDMRKVVGRNVLRFRLEKGLSQEELSFRSGFGRAYLSGLETGKRNPTVITLWELAAVLEVAVADLVQETDEKPKESGEGERKRAPRRPREHGEVPPSAETKGVAARRGR